MQNASINIKAFVEELNEKGRTVSNIRRRAYRDDANDIDDVDECGYQLTFEDGHTLDIVMPDRPLKRVRMPEDFLGGGARGYYQIGIDESWWLWPYAISMALSTPYPDDEKPDTRHYGETDEGRAWHSVWQSDCWRAVTSGMPVADREYVADRVMSHLRHLAARDGQRAQEPVGLRWWPSEAV